MTIDCPAYPYLKKFIIHLQGSTTLPVSRDNDFTHDIMPYMVMAIGKEDMLQPLGESIKLQLSDHLINQRRFYIQQTGAVKLNTKLRISFYAYFHNYTNALIEEGMGKSKAVYKFMDLLDLTAEECDPENLVRYVQRNKEYFLDKRFSSKKETLERLQSILTHITV